MTIAERLRPFCHLPGTSTLLPGSSYQVQIFPCLIRIYHLKHALPVLVQVLSLGLKGPIQQFTICNDLETGQITVAGLTTEGWMRYHLKSSQKQEGVRLFVEKAPLGGFAIQQDSHSHLLQAKEWMDVLGEDLLFEPYQIPSCDRLSLGSHKAQDWELMKRRLNLAEILPLWHRLGQVVPATTRGETNEGTLVLLEACQASFEEENRMDAQESWLNLIRGGFHSLLTPQLEDRDYQGLVPSGSLHMGNLSPLVLLTEGSHFIRRLFFQQEKDQISILPCLLPSLSCGRLLDIPLERGGRLSLEWTKKTIRRLILFVTHDQELTLKFRSHVRQYRLRMHTTDRGEIKKSGVPLLFHKNQVYFFDNFK